MRKDLEMPEGKLAVQVGHAMDQVWKYKQTCTEQQSTDFDLWFSSGRRKILLRLADEADMIKIKNKLIEEGAVVFDVFDYGINFFNGLTFTGLVVFPSISEIKALKRVRVY